MSSVAAAILSHDGVQPRLSPEVKRPIPAKNMAVPSKERGAFLVWRLLLAHQSIIPYPLQIAPKKRSWLSTKARVGVGRRARSDSGITSLCPVIRSTVPVNMEKMAKIFSPRERNWEEPYSDILRKYCWFCMITNMISKCELNTEYTNNYDPHHLLYPKNVLLIP